MPWLWNKIKGFWEVGQEAWLFRLQSETRNQGESGLVFIYCVQQLSLPGKTLVENPGLAARWLGRHLEDHECSLLEGWEGSGVNIRDTLILLCIFYLQNSFPSLVTFYLCAKIWKGAAQAVILTVLLGIQTCLPSSARGPPFSVSLLLPTLFPSLGMPPVANPLV